MLRSSSQGSNVLTYSYKTTNNIIFFDRFFLFLGITRPKTSFADKNQRKLAAWCHSRVGFANYEENLLPKKSTALQRAASGLKRRDESSWTEQIPHCLEIVNFSITAVVASMKTAESGRRGKSKNQTNVDTRSMEEARLNYPEIPGKIFVLVHDLFENVPIWSNTCTYQNQTPENETKFQQILARNLLDSVLTQTRLHFAAVFLVQIRVNYI